MTLRNILLIRTDRIGDVVLTTPAITLLRNQYPDARISFLTRRYTAPLLSHYQGLNDILIYDPEKRHRGWKGAIRLGKTLRQKEFDVAFLFFPRPALSFALWYAGIPQRVGSGYRWSSVFLNKRIFEHRKTGQKHELEYNLSLLRDYLPAIPSADGIEFRFRFDERLRRLRAKALREAGISGEYIIIHPGSGGSAPNLPPDMFVRIIDFITAHSGQSILLVGTEAEARLIDSIYGKLADSSRTIPVSGKWNLETYMAVIAGGGLFISNSTGPLHIARAYDIPLLAFYCPATPCSPRRWGPYNRPDAFLVPDVKPCKSCNPAKCPHGNCLAHIPWPAIRRKLEDYLNRRTQGANGSESPT